MPLRSGQIRDQLKGMGVTLDDRTRVWQAIDGRRGMIGGGPLSAMVAPRPPHPRLTATPADMRPLPATH